MKLVVVMFVMTMTSLKYLRKSFKDKFLIVRRSWTEKCLIKMTEEPTMATAEEAAQRIYAKKTCG